jgi:hypothetical protein
MINIEEDMNHLKKDTWCCYQVQDYDTDGLATILCSGCSLTDIDIDINLAGDGSYTFIM